MYCFIVNPNGVLARHRMFLRNLETKKNAEREEKIANDKAEEAKAAAFREKAEK